MAQPAEKLPQGGSASISANLGHCLVPYVAEGRLCKKVCEAEARVASACSAQRILEDQQLFVDDFHQELSTKFAQRISNVRALEEAVQFSLLYVDLASPASVLEKRLATKAWVHNPKFRELVREYYTVYHGFAVEDWVVTRSAHRMTCKVHVNHLEGLIARHIGQEYGTKGWGAMAVAGLIGLRRRARVAFAAGGLFKDNPQLLSQYLLPCLPDRDDVKKLLEEVERDARQKLKDVEMETARKRIWSPGRLAELRNDAAAKRQRK
eukprot:TRINITY_DN15371_c0_g1_i1.p1 TRINITY_DN15371_c0_g1~~TRINITY_DN15371_c0_g1_i1.p1  ORF type:complete len:265 (+),score=56.03 TRINITY_DN15371_c0_g1_i1:100-894(+)